MPTASCVCASLKVTETSSLETMPIDVHVSPSHPAPVAHHLAKSPSSPFCRSQLLALR